MKKLSLPITLLGRIAHLASKPSREELLKELSTPITISDLMNNDDWINDAFKEAQRNADMAAPVAEKIRAFLDEYTPGILDRWSNMVGRDKAMKFAKFLADNDDARDLVEALTECFTVSGYLFAMIDMKRKNNI